MTKRQTSQRGATLVAAAVALTTLGACGVGSNSSPAATTGQGSTSQAGSSDATTGTSDGAEAGVQTDGFESLGEVHLQILAEANEEATLDLAIAQFTEKYPNVTIDYTLRAFDDYMQVAPGIIGSDDAPDIAQGNQGYTIDGTLVKGGLIVPFDKYSEAYGWEEAFGSGTLDQYRFTPDGSDFGNGDLWGVSGVAEIVGVYYNKEKLAALGEVPTTFEEFEALLEKAKAANELPIQLGNAEGWPALHVYGMLQAAYRPAPEVRAWVFGESGSTVETDADRTAAQTLVDWVDKGYLPEGLNGVAYDDSVAAFGAGDGVFLIAGNWNTAVLEPMLEDNVGYFAVPVGPSGVVGGTGALALPWHVMSSSEHPDLAAAFIAEMMSAEFTDDLVSVGRIPARATDATTEGLLAEVASGANEVIADDGLTLFADWSTPTMYETLTADTQELLGGQMTADEFLADVQGDWDAEHGG